MIRAAALIAVLLKKGAYIGRWISEGWPGCTLLVHMERQ